LSQISLRSRQYPINNDDKASNLSIAEDYRQEFHHTRIRKKSRKEPVPIFCMISEPDWVQLKEHKTQLGAMKLVHNGDYMRDQNRSWDKFEKA